MNKYAFLAKSGSMEIAEVSKAAISNAKRSERRAYGGGDLRRNPLQDESFSLIIRSEDGRTLLETRTEYMHQAFQRLIDWSIGDASRDNACAAINGPNGFYTNHRIKASEDFAWIEGS